MNIEREAIAVLAREGWQAVGRGPDVGMCMYVAMGQVPYVGWEPFEVAVANVAAVIREQYPERVGELPAARAPFDVFLPDLPVLFRFNDHPATTLDDVVAVLEKAAVRRDEMA